MKRLAATLLLCLPTCLPTRIPAQQTPSPAQPSSLADVQALVDRGHLAEASAALQQLAAQKPEPAGVERMRGKILYLRGDLGGADAALANAARQNPADRESSEMRGVVLFRLGKSAEAIPLLQNAHGNIPGTNVDGSYALALCLMQVHRYDDSRHAFATLYGFQPDSSSAYVLAAHMFLRWESVEAADQAARKALTINAHAPEAHLILGLVALAANNVDEAQLQFKQEIAVNAISGPAYEHLGDALIRKQLYPEAQQVLNRAVLLEPYTTGPFILLGQALVKQNKAGLALSYLQHAEQMDPSNILTHTTLMQAYRQTGDKEQAAKEAKAVQDIREKK